MLTQKKTLTFNKENDNRWYLVCDEYEEKVTKEFRETFTYTDKEGKVQKYEKVRDLTNPLDDHTKHPAWASCNPHKDLVICRFLFDGLYPEHFHGKVIK